MHWKEEKEEFKQETDFVIPPTFIEVETRN